MIYIIIGILVLIGDFISKMAVVKNMHLHETIPVIDSVFSFTYIRNKGVAWGMLEDQRWIFITVTILIIGLIIGYIIKKGSIHPTANLGFSLILSGAIGNMIDRIFYKDGVIDFLHAEFIDFPIFNIADCAVCIGAVLIMIYIIFFDKDKKESKDGKTHIQSDRE